MILTKLCDNRDLSRRGEAVERGLLPQLAVPLAGRNSEVLLFSDEEFPGTVQEQVYRMHLTQSDVTGLSDRIVNAAREASIIPIFTYVMPPEAESSNFVLYRNQDPDTVSEAAACGCRLSRRAVQIMASLRADPFGMDQFGPFRSLQQEVHPLRNQKRNAQSPRRSCRSRLAPLLGKVPCRQARYARSHPTVAPGTQRQF